MQKISCRKAQLAKNRKYLHVITQKKWTDFFSKIKLNTNKYLIQGPIDFTLVIVEWVFFFTSVIIHHDRIYISMTNLLKIYADIQMLFTGKNKGDPFRVLVIAKIKFHKMLLVSTPEWIDSGS